MKCKSCRGPAVVEVRRHNAAFCRNCFVAYVRGQVEKAIRRFEMLRPGGQLIVANFLPGVRDVGYMEIFMDWRLVYRTRQDMVDLTAEIEEPDLREVRLFAEENHNIVFLELTRD